MGQEREAASDCASVASSAASGLTAKALKGMSQGELVQMHLQRSARPLVDIGVNLCDKAFEKDLPGVVQRAKEAHVAAMVVTGVCVDSSKAARDLCNASSPDPSFPLYFTAGVHPHDAKDCDDTTLGALKQIAADPKCVAIGECGLDFNRNFSPPDVQEKWFGIQVGLAKELNKPLFMHCREAGSKLAEVLGRYHPLLAPAVVHCFTGTREELESFIELDLYIGITGWVCDERTDRGGAELAALLPTIPANRLLIETDAPYLTPRTIMPSKARPHRNEPALLPHVLRRVAEALGKTEEEVATMTTENAERCFSISVSE